MHVVDGLEEWEHGAVVGDAAPTHVVALHAVEEGGDGILQSLQELLVVLLWLPVLVLLLEVEMRGKQSTERHLWSTHTQKYYYQRLLLKLIFNIPPQCWLAEPGREFLQADWSPEEAQPLALEQGRRGWDFCEPLPASSPSTFCSGNEPAGRIWHITMSITSIMSDFH